VTDNTESVACTCAHLADERKADDIVVLEVAELTVLAEYFVIATGRNVRQINAIAREIDRQMEELDQPRLGVEGEAESGWVLIDLADVIVHLFTPRMRELYDLEMLWGDAPRVEWQDVEPLATAGPRPEGEIRGT
jgi:ribosome-associated protein